MLHFSTLIRWSSYQWRLGQFQCWKHHILSHQQWMVFFKIRKVHFSRMIVVHHFCLNCRIYKTNSIYNCYLNFICPIVSQCPQHTKMQCSRKINLKNILKYVIGTFSSAQKWIFRSYWRTIRIFSVGNRTTSLQSIWIYSIKNRLIS